MLVSRAGVVAQQIKTQLAMLASHMIATSSPHALQTPVNASGKAVSSPIVAISGMNQPMLVFFSLPLSKTLARVNQSMFL